MDGHHFSVKVSTAKVITINTCDAETEIPAAIGVDETRDKQTVLRDIHSVSPSHHLRC